MVEVYEGSIESEYDHETKKREREEGADAKGNDVNRAG